MAQWIETVDASDLKCLGGDANRIYQLLVEGDSKLNLSTLEAASAREGLFSKKQIKTLLALRDEAEALHVTKKSQVVSPPLREANAKSTSMIETSKTFAHTNTSAAATEKRLAIKSPKHQSLQASASDDLPLLTLLKIQKASIKGTPEAFCQWLIDTEDILSVDDLATAVSNADYLRGVLQKGNGSVGVKGFRCEAFKNAVLVAASAAATETMWDASAEGKENLGRVPIARH